MRPRGGSTDEPPSSLPTSTAPSAAPAPAAAPTAPPTEELTFTACGLTDNPHLGPEAVMRITNRTPKTVTIYVLVGFFSKDGSTRYDTGHATAEGLPPGQSKLDEATSLKPELRKHGRNGFTCKVVDVIRKEL